MRQVSTTVQYYYWGGISRFYLELLMTMSHLLDTETREESKRSPALPPWRQWIIHGEGGQGEGLPWAFSVNNPLASWREGRGQQGYRNGESSQMPPFQMHSGVSARVTAMQVTLPSPRRRALSPDGIFLGEAGHRLFPLLEIHISSCKRYFSINPTKSRHKDNKAYCHEIGVLLFHKLLYSNTQNLDHCVPNMFIIFPFSFSKSQASL